MPDPDTKQSRYHPDATWMWDGPNDVRIIHLVTHEGGFGHSAWPESATIRQLRDSLTKRTGIFANEAMDPVALSKQAAGAGGFNLNGVNTVVK